MSLALLLVLAAVILLAAYRFYGGFLERRFEVDPQRPVPAQTQRDGVDYVPTRWPVLFGHHFSSIAGAGPIVGPIIAGLAFGWLPALLWILAGSIFIGGVHDYSSLMASLRHKGRSIGQVCREQLSPGTYYLLLIFTWVAMVYVIIVFLDLTATTFVPGVDESAEQGGAVATASLLYIGLAAVFGLLVYRSRLTLAKGSLIFVPLVFLALWVGLKLPLTADMVPALGGSVKNTWSILLLVYCFGASILPVWLLLQPRDYLSSYLLFACLAGGALGGAAAGLSGHATIQYPAFRGWSDASLGLLYPALFITVACGAISGFHSMVASGTTSKQLDNERSARPVAYGGMLTEAFLAVVALATVMVLAGAPRAGSTPVGIFADGIGHFVAAFGLSPQVGTTFGLLAVSTFLLTTLDTCTRLARFLVEELTGMRGSWGRYLGTAVTLIIPAVMVFVEIPGPNGTTLPAWRAIWPAFGATNQLLGALALLVVYTWLRHTGRKSWYVFWPMVFMFVTTLLALVMLVRRNLGPEGNVYVGIVSLALAVLAVLVLVNAVWRWRLSPVTGTAAPSVS